MTIVIPAWLTKFFVGYVFGYVVGGGALKLLWHLGITLRRSVLKGRR